MMVEVAEAWLHCGANWLAKARLAGEEEEVGTGLGIVGGGGAGGRGTWR